MVVHQTALYDSIWALVIFLVLLRLERKPHPKGFLVLTWAAMYSLGRILTDFTRVDKTWFGTGLTGSQLTAIAVLVLSLVLLTLRRKSPVVAAVSPGKGTAGATPPEKPAGEAEDSEATPLVPVEPVDPAAPEAAAPGEPVDPAVPVGAALPDIEQDSQPAAERPSEPIQEEPDALSTVEEEASVAGADEPRMPAPETVGAVDAAEALVVEASLPLDAPVGEADPGDVAEVAALVETQEAAAEPAVESLFPADIEQVQAEQQVRAEQPETEDRDPERQNPETELLAVTPDEPTAAGPEPGVPETPEQD
jgi:hypothetical protein